jgi:hypothetical protein
MAIDDDVAGVFAIPDFWEPTPWSTSGDAHEKGGADFFSLNLKGKNVETGIGSCIQDAHATCRIRISN